MTDKPDIKQMLEQAYDGTLVTHLEPGAYPGQVTNITRRVSQQNNPMLVVTFEVDGMKVYTRWMLTPSDIASTVGCLKTLGASKETAVGIIDAPEGVNCLSSPKSVIVTLGTEQDFRNPELLRNRVVKFELASTASAAAPTPTPEPPAASDGSGVQF